ncbi:ATP-binding protein [Prochlorococcus sp. AH-716-K03]|nr:ATP-binding protein [Prochlorococcus sp. AH-716-K03]
MSFFQGKFLLNLIINLLNRPTINWSNFELDSSLQLNDFVDLLLEPLNASQYRYRLKLGLHEALINAVTHGNNLDPKKLIRVRRIITPNWCVWQIQDQGNGLESKKRIYKLPDKIGSLNGRGLYIINECFDDIRWSNKGNRLQLALKR